MIRRDLTDDNAVRLQGIVDPELATRAGEVIVGPVYVEVAVVLVGASRPTVCDTPLAQVGKVGKADVVGRCTLDVAVRVLGNDCEGSGEVSENHRACFDCVSSGVVVLVTIMAALGCLGLELFLEYLLHRGSFLCTTRYCAKRNVCTETASFYWGDLGSEIHSIVYAPFTKH